MKDALTPLLQIAALVLCVAGVAKLRAPAGAARAARELGLPAGDAAARVLGTAELALGLLVLISPGRVLDASLAALYASFAAIALLLYRRSQACGCFGEEERPASAIQSGVSGALATIALAATVRTPHALGWVFAHGALSAAILVLGTAGAAYATVIAYTELPAAWLSWSRP